ncbi:MAG: cell wall-associated protein wapA [Bdellovibrionaceae bacterium]|nr:cell wall-associated protein wapA [Pseudobdellovibrionaceae bacterium]
MKRALFVFLLFAAIRSHALVDMKNANYSNTWIDMEVPGSGFDLRVVRTYNSRSLFNGIFGFGWCSDFETSLEITGDSNIKIKECGGGQEIVFSPREMTKKDVDTTINTILSKMKADKKVGQTETFYKDMSTKLYEDDDLRSEYARQYGIPVSVKEGTKYSAKGREIENVIFNKSYYTRNMIDGSAQRFDLQGKLTHLYDKNGNFLKFDYEKDQIKEVSDNNSRRLVFKFYPNKKVKTITGPNGLLSEYRFSNLDDLSSVRNAWAKVYNFEYDDLHNLTKATWPDKTSIAIKYDKKNDWVMSFTDREKCTESYKYEFADNDPRSHYWSTVKKVCGKESIADNKYEFWHKLRPDGQYFLQRVQSNVGGNVTDISYHEVFGKPVSIRRNAEKISYEYYPDGQVKIKASSSVRMTFEYDPQSKKVSQVSSAFYNEKGQKVNTKSSQFKYDTKGNLVYAQNSDGQKINMTYDSKGRIATITDHAKKVVKIEYEERYGKPAVVTRPGLGTIRVTYKNNGEINKVDSKEGPSVAMQVASTFNNLLDVVAPATSEIF